MCYTQIKIIYQTEMRKRRKWSSFRMFNSIETRNMETSVLFTGKKVMPFFLFYFNFLNHHPFLPVFFLWSFSFFIANQFCFVVRWRISWWADNIISREISLFRLSLYVFTFVYAMVRCKNNNNSKTLRIL